jgi:hypothetical protein
MAWDVQKSRGQTQVVPFAGGPPVNDHKAVLGLACPQGVDGLGMAVLGETIRSPWPPLAYAYDDKKTSDLRLNRINQDIPLTSKTNAICRFFRGKH